MNGASPRSPICRALLGVLMLISTVHAADDLPKKGSDDALETEPQLLINNVPEGRTALPDPESALPVDTDLVRLSAQVERAKKNAALGERLFKAGVLAKLEAEKRSMQVPRLIKALETARLRIAKEEAERERSKFQAGDSTKEALEKAEAALASATASAAEAEVGWQNSLVEAAQLDVARQRKLVAFGFGTVSAVRRAEQHLATLKGEPVPEEARRPAVPVSKRRRGL